MCGRVSGWEGASLYWLRWSQFYEPLDRLFTFFVLHVEQVTDLHSPQNEAFSEFDQSQRPLHDADGAEKIRN